ncbi:MAG: hypothetical protein JWP89_6937 [Schlesneria sp.]|nr:hypothetical protein [Schlesneria sp.]
MHKKSARVRLFSSLIPSHAPDREPCFRENSVRDTDRALWPLALTSFERFLLHGEDLNYPATFYVELHLEGQFDRTALQEALRVAVLRHPLLCATVVQTGWRESWQPASEPPHALWQSTTDAPGPPLGRWIDLRRECGLRIWVREQPQLGDVLYLQFHHSCTDGLGAGRFIIDLMSEYSRLVCRQPDLVTSSADLLALKNRDRFRRFGQTSRWQKTLNAYRFHVLTPTPLAAPNHLPVPSGSTAPVIATHVFDRDETDCFVSKTATLGGCSINDVGLALLFRAVSLWQKSRGRESPSQRLRILMPIDLREAGDRFGPATNRVGFSFPSRSIKECDNWHQLLNSLREEIRFIRRTRLGMDFINGLKVTDTIPGLLPMLLRSPGCMATTLLTNFGQTRRYEQFFPVADRSMLFGNMRLHHIVATPPISRACRVGFGMCLTSGRLVLTVQCDPALFDNKSAGELLQVFVSIWRQWVDDRMTV